MNYFVPIAILVLFAFQAAGAPTTMPADALAHKKYRSIELHEGGAGRDGPVLRHWWLSFGKMSGNTGVYAWDWSDVRSVGMYRLSGDGTLHAEGKIEARYDPATDRVLWNGMWYERYRPPTTKPSPASRCGIPVNTPAMP